MDTGTAQAIASVCGLMATIAVVIGQVLLGRQLAVVKHLVNGQSHSLNRLIGDEAYSRGRLSVVDPAPESASGPSAAPANITAR